MSEEITKALETLRKSMVDDPEYAWSWHCNVAMSSYDEGLSHQKANKAAARFMNKCFGINTTKNEHYKKLFPTTPLSERNHPMI